jgi:hypothetical protein
VSRDTWPGQGSRSPLRLRLLILIPSHTSRPTHLCFNTLSSQSMADPAVVALATELTNQTRLSDADWNKVETTAQALANSLRSRNSACSFIRVDNVRIKITMHHRRNSDRVGRHTATCCPRHDCQGHVTRLASTRCLSSPRIIRDASRWSECLCRPRCDLVPSASSAPNNLSQTRTGATSSTRDSSKPSLPYSSATPTSSPKIKQPIFSRSLLPISKSSGRPSASF